jgi:hypothetical protein
LISVFDRYNLIVIEFVNLFVVHGTWVSGRRIQPGVHVPLTEGDTLEIGCSTRVYELNWVPPSQVVDGCTVSAIKKRQEEKEAARQAARKLLPPRYPIKNKHQVA